MPRSTREVASGLEGKGFVRRTGDHAFFHLHVGGKKTAIFTKVSHGEKEIHDGLLGAMARQVRLTKRKFLDLVDCPLKEEEYVSLLREGGHIE